MRTVIGCCALLGLAVILSVVGCIGLIGYQFASLPDIPPYATAPQIERTCGRDLDLLRKAIAAHDLAGLDGRLSQDILALYRGDTEVLKRSTYNGTAHILVNHAGVGILDHGPERVQCLAYELPGPDAEYVVFIYDAIAMAKRSPPAPAAPPVPAR